MSIFSRSLPSPSALINARRLLLLLVGAAVAVPLSLAQLAVGHIGLGRALWQMASPALVAWLARTMLRREGESIGHWAVIPVLLTLSGPVTLFLEGSGPAEQATLVLLPVVLCVLFFDQFVIVSSVLVAGLISVTAWFAWSGLSVLQMAGVIFGEIATAAMLALTSAWLRSVRRLELEAEQQRSQALRMSETRRAHAERLAIVGRLASGVAHEINNPLAYVKANVGVLRRDLFASEPLPEAEAHEILDETTAGIERICQIVADLKAFAREGKDEIEPVDLRDLVDGAVRLASVRLPIGMKPVVEIHRGTLVRANRRKLSQVVLNLLVNAGEALEEARTSRPFITVRTEHTDDGVVLSIEDNGPGMTDEVQQRLFEPFFTTKGPGKGTGLGLALSREYLAGFGASIRAASAPGGGARFLVMLRMAVVTGETPVPGRLVA
ncbi:MAG: hypothetical protein GQE15_35635 [Archangiaceae bacterium]|nr:hypothetical protein [Archangiaceae bacterium]